MIASAPVGCPSQFWNTSVELVDFYQAGLIHSTVAVRQQFSESVEIAQQAIRESGSELMIIAALLYRPCHMLAKRDYSPQPWNGDSLIESGTFDWLVDLAGEAVAEVIRLQPHIRRYLVSVNPDYHRRLRSYERIRIARDGGKLNLQARNALSRNRYFSEAMQLARWIDQVRAADH